MAQQVRGGRPVEAMAKARQVRRSRTQKLAEARVKVLQVRGGRQVEAAAKARQVHRGYKRKPKKPKAQRLRRRRPER